MCHGGILEEISEEIGPSWFPKHETALLVNAVFFSKTHLGGGATRGVRVRTGGRCLALLLGQSRLVALLDLSNPELE